MRKAALLLTVTALCHLLYAKPADDKSIVILYENDVHCAINGYQKMAGLRDRIADTAYVAVVGCGDFVQGGTAGAISRGQYVADIMQYMDYAAITLGNHEFDYPVAHTAKLLKHIGVPVVSANFTKQGKNKPLYKPFVIKRFGKTKVAFVGASTPTTFYTEAAAFYNGDKQVYEMHEKDSYVLIQKAVNKARKKGAQYVVVLSHLGEDPNQTDVDSHGLVRNTTGIDIVLDGHTHSVVLHDTVLNKAGKPVVVSETGTAFMNVGKLLITPDGRLTNTLIPVKDIPYTNERVRLATDSVKQLMRELTQRVVCHSDVALRLFDAEGNQLVRMEETNTGDIICDAYRIISGADIALANGGGIRKEKFAGDLTYGDITDILPYDNNLWVVEATGATLLELLRRCTALLPLEDGFFPQVSGMRYTVHVKDHTVSDVEVLNRTTGEYEPIQPQKTYSVATIDYCVTGGGFYDILRNCKVIYRGDRLYRDVFVDYIEKHLNRHITNNYAEPQGRIRIIKN